MNKGKKTLWEDCEFGFSKFTVSLTIHLARLQKT